MIRENTPVIVGVGQYTQPKDHPEPLDPLRLMAVAGGLALADGCAKNNLRERIDGLYVVNLFSWSYRDVCLSLANHLGIDPKERIYGALGGNTPQLMVNRAAMAIWSGKCRSVMIAGAEAGCAVRRMRNGHRFPGWPEKEAADGGEADDRPPFTPYEMTYDIFAPAHAYAFFENAQRPISGWTIDTHRRRIGELCERLSSVAADHPHAWTREKFSAARIIRPAPDNRYVAFPYTLRMNANIHVDMSAAVVLTSIKEARAMGIDPSRWVYPMGGAGLSNVWHVARRPGLGDSPAIRHSARLALEQAGCTAADMDMFDFYSCFPCAVEMACRELGVPLDDNRPLSVTGGLSYFGGPGNNYVLHSIASMVEKIRANPDDKGLVTAMGWYNTKIAVGIYGGAPPAHVWEGRDDGAVQEEISAKNLPPPEEKPRGPMTVETYIICHDRSGEPEHGTVIGKLGDGRRAMAFIDGAAGDLEMYENQDLIGCRGSVRHDAATGKNLFRA